jgi:capsid protein
VSYVVTAADGSTKTYTITVTIAPSPAKDITSFAFLSVDNSGLSADVPATISGTTITATVPFGTNVNALVATFSTTGASVGVGGNPQTSGVTKNNFTTQVVYMVTAADGSQQSYTVSVAIAPSPAKDITSFAFLTVDNSGLPANVTATITGTAIAATVPSGTDLTALIATFTSTGASVSVSGALQASGITPNDFAAPVDYHVTAADGSTQDYTVTITAL